MVMMANPVSVERSMSARGSIAIRTVAAAIMIIVSARESLLRYTLGDGTIPSCRISSVITTSWSIPVPRTAIRPAIVGRSDLELDDTDKPKENKNF